jgi:hypothetical protein
MKQKHYTIAVDENGKLADGSQVVDAETGISVGFFINPERMFDGVVNKAVWGEQEVTSGFDALAMRLVARGIPAEAISTGGGCEAVVATTPDIQKGTFPGQTGAIDVFVGDFFWSVTTVTNLDVDLTRTSDDKWQARLADEQFNADGDLCEAHAWYPEQSIADAGGEDWTAEQVEEEFVRQWEAAMALHNAKDWSLIMRAVEEFANSNP